MLDFTTLLPGPLATLMLVDAGAEVIKVEKGGQIKLADLIIEVIRSKPFQYAR